MIKLTKNFTKSSTPKIGFIIHGTVGNYEGAVDWLYQPCENRNPVTYSSAHYVIAKDGRMTQLVKNEDVSWHAGTVKNPTPEAAKVLPKTLVGTYKNPNDSFIGIELEWFPGDKVTESQYLEIVKIIKASGIENPVILCHTQVTDYKSDFGADSGQIVQTIKSMLSPSVNKDNIKAQIMSLLNQL